VVHAAICEATGELRGGNQISGGGMENVFDKSLKRLFSRSGVG
jgi:hypothetical protein